MKRIASCLLISTLAVACNMPQQQGEPENTAPPSNALNDPNHPGIEACAQGNVDAELQVARDFEDSCHEMVVCGGLSAAFTITLFEVLINAASGNSTSPSGFKYVGQGRYAAGTRMELTLRLAADTSFGVAGDAVDFDLFELSNYFTNAKVKASASIDLQGNATTAFTVEFEGTGPGYELLGLPPQSAGSIEFDFAAMAKSLGQGLTLEQRIFMHDERDDTTVTYELFSPATQIGEYFEKGPMAMQLVSVSGANAALGQTLFVADWGMQYSSTSSSGTLDGTIELEISGGAFDYGASFVYPHRKEPDVSLRCL